MTTLVVIIASALYANVFGAPTAGAATTKPTAAQCRLERKLLKVAEDLLFVTTGRYGPQSDLIPQFMKRKTRLFSVDVLDGGHDFEVVAVRKYGCA